MSLLAGDHLSGDYIKKNPQHTIPTLEDDGAIIWDSHAIATYLVSKYAKRNTLYPTDLVTRAKIDQRLHFDSGILFVRLRGTIGPILFHGVREISEENRVAFLQGYDFLESFLQTDLYLVGNTLTLADLCTIATVSSMNFLVEIEGVKYPKLTAWIKRMESLPYYHVNRDGVTVLKQLFLSKMALVI